MSGSNTRPVQSSGATSSKPTETESSPLPRISVTLRTMASDSRCFCASDLPGHSLTMT